MLWLLVLAFVGLCADNSLADPRTWDLDGVSVRQAYSVSWNGQTAQGEDGSVLAIWTDARNGRLELFGQLLAPSGEPQWGLNGRLLAHTEGIGIYWPVITYSSDGWVVVWQDADVYNTSEEVVIRGRMKAMKFSSTAASLWSDPEQTGLLLYEEQTRSLQEGMVWVERDANGGAYCCWINETYFYAQRVTSDGTIAWTNPIETNHGGNGWGYAVEASSDGKLLIAWKQHPAQYEILCNKINPNGNNAWTSPAVVCRQPAFVTSVKLLADSSGGAALLWLDERTSEIADFYWRNVTAGGQAVGPANGHLVYTPTSVKTAVRMLPSLTDGVLEGALISWQEESNGVTLGFVQKVNLYGNIRWGEFPIPLCEPESPDASQTMINLTTDNMGRGICVWNESNGMPGDGRVRVAFIDSAEMVWDDCAVTLHNGFSVETPRIVVTGENSVVTFWRESYNPSGSMFVQSQDLDDGSVNFPDALGWDDLIDGRSYNHDLFSLPGGRTVAAWQDTRSQSNDLYFQILDATGAIELMRDGVELVTFGVGSHPYLENPVLCSDGSGGFFAGFAATSNTRVISVTRWNSAGVQVGPEEGITVSASEFDVSGKFGLCPDGSSGVFAAFSQFDPQFSMEVYATRIGADCQPIWNEPLHVPSPPNFDADLIDVFASDNGSCIVVWRTGEFQNYYYRAARVLPNGTIDWTADVTPLNRDAHHFEVESDHQGGLAAVWQYNDEPELYQIWAQRVNSSGELSWATNGLVAGSADEMVYSPKVCVDDHNDMIVAWLKYVTDTENDVFAQKLSPAGQTLWQTGGLYIQNANQNSMLGDIVAVNYENIYITWTGIPITTPQTSRVQVYGTHLNASGVVGSDPFWQVNNGPSLCAASFTDNIETVVGTDGSIVVAWTDYRASFPLSSVYAQRIYDPIPTSADEKPVVPTEFSLSQNYPNPFNPETVIEFALPNASKATLKVFDVTGRAVSTLINEPLAAGTHRVNFDAASLPSGVYFYTLRADHHSMTRKMVLLK